MPFRSRISIVGCGWLCPTGHRSSSSADLNGKRVGVEWGSEGDMVGRQWQRDGIDLTLVPFETPQDAVAALAGIHDENQAVDAILVDSVTLRQAQAAGAALSAAGAYVTSNPYVIVVPRRAHRSTATDQHWLGAAAGEW